MRGLSPAPAIALAWRVGESPRPLAQLLRVPTLRRAQHPHRAGAVRGASCNEPAAQGHSVTVGPDDCLGCECCSLSRQGCRRLVLPRSSTRPLSSGAGWEGRPRPSCWHPESPPGLICEGGRGAAGSRARPRTGHALPRARHRGRPPRGGRAGRWARGQGPPTPRGGRGTACTQESEKHVCIYVRKVNVLPRKVG